MRKNLYAVYPTFLRQGRLAFKKPRGLSAIRRTGAMLTLTVCTLVAGIVIATIAPLAIAALL